MSVRVGPAARVVVAEDDGVISADRLCELVRRVRRAGGHFTVSALSGYDMRSGYAVSVHPERETLVALDVRWQDLLDFVARNWDLLGKSGACLSGWRTPDGFVWLSVTVLVGDRQRAERLAAQHGQPVVFDLRPGRVVPMGTRAG